MKNTMLLCCCLLVQTPGNAQLYIAPGDSISVLPGTIFTLQENLENNGKIYNNGVLTLNGTVLQHLSGSGGIVENLTLDNNAQLQSDIIINNALLVNAGQVLDINASQLTNNGNISGVGLLRGSLNAKLQLNGTGVSNIQTDQTNDASSNAFKTIGINNSTALINFKDRLYVYEALLPSAGTLTINDELILRSGNTGTARVGPVGSTINYAANGKFVIERYIPGNRAWRLLTAPVTAASLVKISEAWQDNAPRVTNMYDINSTNNPHPGYGTHITYGLPAVNGYDQGINGNTSIRYLVSTGWNGIPTATNDGSTANSGYITDQPGYLLFVRGDRSTHLWQGTSAVTSPTVLRPKGKIRTGTVNYPLGNSYDNGAGSVFRVIGNPYPSPLNFHSLISNPVNAANGFTDAFYEWDPNITGTYGVGGFVGLSYNAGASIAAGHPVYDRTVITTPEISTIDNSGDIPSGSAIVIDYNGPASSLRIEENNKAVGSNNSFFRPAGQLRTSLLVLNADSTKSINDGVLVSFDEQGNDAVDKNDLQKLGNFAENIAIRKSTQLICIERRKPVAAGDTIFYHTTKLRQKEYQLQFNFDKVTVPAGTAAFLEDLYLQQQIPVSFSDTTNYSFNVSAKAASADSSRFRMLFKKINEFALIKAAALDQNIAVQWTIIDSFDIDHYSIARSTDGIHFVTIATSVTNEWLDEKLSPGKYYYRVQCINKKGIVSTSEIAAAIVTNQTRSIYVFPNPVINGSIQLHISKEKPGWYTVRILDNSGRMVKETGFYYNGGQATQNITMDAAAISGMYHLELKRGSEKVNSSNILFK